MCACVCPTNHKLLEGRRTVQTTVKVAIREQDLNKVSVAFQYKLTVIIINIDMIIIIAKKEYCFPEKICII